MVGRGEMRDDLGREPGRHRIPVQGEAFLRDRVVLLRLPHARARGRGRGVRGAGHHRPPHRSLHRPAGGHPPGRRARQPDRGRRVRVACPRVEQGPHRGPPRVGRRGDDLVRREDRGPPHRQLAPQRRSTCGGAIPPAGPFLPPFPPAIVPAMSRFPRARAAEQDEPVRALTFGDARGWLFLAMGLAGILTVALIVTADRSYAGIDGMRAVRAQVPENEQDPPRQASATIPLLGGIVAVIHDIAPLLFAAAPAADPLTAASQPSARPPSATAPAASQAPGAPPAPTASPPPTAPPAPTAPPTPTATPPPPPTPPLTISTDRGATAIVNVTGLVPGDSMSRTVTVQNSGGLSFKYTVSATQTASTLLWTDLTDGLQLTVKTTGGVVLYSGPLSGLRSAARPSGLPPGATEPLRYLL